MMAGQPAADGVDLAREEAEAASLLLATQLQAEAEREVDWRAEYAAAQEVLTAYLARCAHTSLSLVSAHLSADKQPGGVPRLARGRW